MQAAVDNKQVKIANSKRKLKNRKRDTFDRQRPNDFRSVFLPTRTRDHVLYKMAPSGRLAT